MGYRTPGIPEHLLPEEEDEGWVPLGEALSSEDMQLAAVTLFEQGVQCHWAHTEREVDELRRVIEAEYAGEQLMVLPQDAERAFLIAGRWLSPLQHWVSVEDYLESRPSDDLVKILDLAKLWEEPTLKVAREVLCKRGHPYPPNGASSDLLPWCCLVLAILGGPFAGLVFRWRIDQHDKPPHGGLRPHYDNATRERADRFLFLGFKIWIAIITCLFALKFLFFRDE